MIKICTCADKRSDFIELQNSCFKKFINEDYEYVVFNNAKKEELDIIDSINNTCKQLNIRCIKTDRNNDNHGHGKALNYIYKSITNEFSEYIFLIDFDMFLLKEFSISSFLCNYEIAGTEQNRQHVFYLWPGLLIFNQSKLPNKDTIDLEGGLVDNIPVDTGGQLAVYIKNNSINIKKIFQYGLATKDQFSEYFNEEITEKYDPMFAFQIYENSFLHFVRGTNWDNSSQDYMDRKTKLLNEIIYCQINNNKIFKG